MIDQINQIELRRYVEAFYFGYRQFTALPDQILSEKGLNRAHHRILYFVGQNPGIGVGGLLEILQVSKQAMNLPLRQLIEMELIVSEPASHDRRIKQLTLTDSGQQFETQLTMVQMKLLEEVIDQCALDSAAGWYEVMEKLSA